MAKVLVLSTHILWESHYETELEIMQNHLDAGDTVLQLVCNTHFKVCDTNPEHRFAKCVDCMAKRRHGLSLLKGEVVKKAVINLKPEDSKVLDNFKWQASTVDELKTVHFKNYDIGYSVASSIISILFNPNPDLNKHQPMVQNLMNSALEVYLSIRNYLSTEKPDVLYVFNGRLAQTKAAFKAAEAEGIKCLIHERGSTYRHYDLFENFLPHDIKYMEKKIIKFWNDNPDLEFKTSRSRYFYEKRRKGTILSWKSFTENQKKGLLPEGFDFTKKNIVIFNSSEFEFTAVSPEWDNPVYTNQNEGIIKILESLKNIKDIHVYIRLHPNLADADPENYQLLKTLNYENMTLILPHDSIDSYVLLDQAYKVVTFGSTMAVEATYWGKVSIMAGHGFFENLNVVYKPNTHEEMIKFILDEDLKPIVTDGADIFGYFYAESGILFKYYEPDAYNKGKFKAVQIDSVLNEKERKWMNRYWVYRKYRLIETLIRKVLIKSLKQ